MARFQLLWMRHAIDVTSDIILRVERRVLESEIKHRKNLGIESKV